MSGIYWLASYPKSGNTWFRIFLKNLLDPGDKPANINQLRSYDIASSHHWLDDVLGFEASELSGEEIENLRPAVYRWVTRNSEPGYHKTHDAYTYTAEGEPLLCREATLGALYIIRNPLDVALSYAHHNGSSVDEAIALMHNREHALNDCRNQYTNQARQRLLTWSEHVLSWVDAPHLSCQTIRYEDMIATPVATFSRAVQFLQLPGNLDSISKAIEFSRFDVVSQQEVQHGFKERRLKENRFFRQGTCGEWQRQLNQEQIARIISNHREVMERFGYVDASGRPY